MNNLPDLKDIHIPDDVSMFPLAYGWWIILLGIMVSVVVVRIILFILKTSKKIYSQKKLNSIVLDNPVCASIQISELLRRICSVKHKYARVLYGNDWINFLENQTSLKLSSKAQELLIYAPFIDKNSTNYSTNEAQELKNLCEKFIGGSL